MAKHSKEEIITKGIELIRKNGYYGTGVQQVLKACHIPKGSFYHYFNSKKDFALHAVEKYAQDTIDDLDKLMKRDELSGKEKIESFFKDQLEFYRDQKYEMTCLMSIISFEVGSVDTELSETITQKFHVIKDRIAAMTSQGQEQGEINRSLPPDKIASYLVDGFNGALVTMKYEQTSRGIEQFLDVNMSLLEP
ncbi:MAG: TetR family transcriptional regulator [Bacteroidetes bacterium]|jgi:TetR/AcrR family transcriptional repressor of nem operon|nr:TetR family transcriptional regulator [Bacteroidota bacterium]